MSVETLSFEQINQRPRGRDSSSTVLLERSDRTISTGQYHGVLNQNGYEVNVTMPDGSPGYRDVSLEMLSDQKQAQLAQELAGRALRDTVMSGSSREAAVETAVPATELMYQLTDGLSTDDRENLRWFASALVDKAHSQQAGDGEGSMYAGQRAGSYLADLSPEARKIAYQYAALSSKG